MSIFYPDNTASRTALPASGINDSTLLLNVSYSGIEKRLSLEELKKTSVQVVNVKQYGAVGDGVTDDTLAISGAISAASNKTVYFSPGTYLINTALNLDVDTYFYGDNATILSNVSGDCLTLAGNISIDNLIFTANNNTITERLLYYAGVSTDSFNISNCTFKDMKANTYSYALTVGLCDTFKVTNCYFSSIKSLLNGVVGDTNGSVRAIMFNYTCNKGIVSNCYFDDINNITSSGTFAFEDADAVQCSLGSGSSQSIHFSNCNFTNCGKRALKLQGKTGSKYIVSDCKIKSSYTGTSDVIGSTDNGMYCAIDCFAGQIKISDVEFVGGVCNYFVSISTSGIDGVEINNCTYYPEYHRYALGAQTTFLYIANTTPNSANILVNNNSVKNVHFGIDKYNGSDIIISSNSMGTQGNSIGLNSSGHSICSNNYLYFLSATGMSGNPYAFYLASGLESAIFSNNVVDRLGDGIYLDAQAEPPTYKLIVTGNTFNSLNRNIFSNFNNGRAPYVYFDNNNPSTTVMLSKAGKVHTYTTAAPTSGSGYVGDIVWNTAPAASGFIGWVCTTSGSPGTWKTFGAITP